MPKIQAVTCQIRYTLDLSKLDAFESYARVPLCLVGRLYGSYAPLFPYCRSLPPIHHFRNADSPGVICRRRAHWR